MLDLAFIQQCAPAVPPITVNALVKTESSFNPWAIGVNKAQRLTQQPKSFNQALQIADQLFEKKSSFDLGLAQINSSNLNYLKLTPSQVLDPCTNLRAMQTIFVNCFNRAKLKTSSGERAAAMAFSCYNTGNFVDGFNNGYVTKVLKNHNYVSNALNNNPNIYKTQGQMPVQVSSVAQSNLSNKAKDFIDITSSENIADYVEQSLTKQDSNDQQSVSNDTIITALAEANDIVKDYEVDKKTFHSWDVFKNF